MPTAAVSTAPISGDPGSSRAWGWVVHLEGGGTTTWRDWRDQPDEAAAEAPAGARWVPGAQQLELLRRLNLSGRPNRSLVRRVLTAAATGRGRHDLALAGWGPRVDAVGQFAPEPVDPAELTDDDLLRVAVGLLAADVVQAGSSAIPSRTSTATMQTHRRTRRWRTRYRLVGDPELAHPRRTALIADGRPPGGKGAAVLVLGTDLATMLGHAWVAGAFAEGGPSWPDYLTAWRQRGGVPRRIDLAAIADRWRSARATGSVDVVLDLDVVPDLLRLRRGPDLVTPPPLPEGGAELARRTTIALGLLAPAGSTAHATALRSMLSTASGTPPVVPPEHQAWVGRRAVQMRDRLERSGHRIVGDPGALVPHEPSHPAAASSPNLAMDLALDLALDLLLDPR